MYSKEEASQLRQAFWTAFGLYMAPIPNVDGEKINWINYKTGIKYLNFKLDAVQNTATVAIEMTHPDAGVQQLYLEQLEQFRNAFTKEVGKGWVTELHVPTEGGKFVTRIFTQLSGARIFNKEDWPSLISFFKKNIMALDAFWSNYKFAFEALN